MSEKPIVAVLLGGRNSENYRSCLSSKDVIDALEAKGYLVKAYGMTMEANWVEFNDLASLRNSLNKENFELTDEAIKDIIDAATDELNLPKKIIKRMAKTQFKNSFQSEVAESKEFEALFESMQDVK